MTFHWAPLSGSGCSFFPFYIGRMPLWAPSLLLGRVPVPYLTVGKVVHIYRFDTIRNESDIWSE